MAILVNVKNLQNKLNEINKSNQGKHKVCVVGVLGHSHLHNKDAVLNRLVNHNVFKTNTRDFKGRNLESDDDIKVKMFYAEEEKTVFLQLNTVHDCALLLNAAQQINPNLNNTGSHHYWQGHQLKHATSLLFLFSVCHIVVIMFPTPRFDLSYIRLFKLLASVRYAMLHNLSQSLGLVENIPEIWRSTGRPCIPRIIFSFQTPWRYAKGLNEVSMRKLQQSLQEQIHLILKKNRLLGSLSSSSLFTVSSPNQLFVHVQPAPKHPTTPKNFFINQMLQHSIKYDMLTSVNLNKSRASTTSQPSPAKQPTTTTTTAITTLTLREFLFKQIEHMMTVESRDVPAEGRRGTHVEAPNILMWYRVCGVVYDYFLGTPSETNSHINALAQTIDIDWKFSENRCCKVLPMATNAYLDNLPSHYTQSVHLNHLSASMRVFVMNARGPAYEHYLTQLQKECNQVWWNGRHLCEAISMTGQACVYPFHEVVETSDESESHSSRVSSISACNCGRTQGTREDPFYLKAANYSFYQDLEKKCCSYLIHLSFPSFPADQLAQTPKPASVPTSPIRQPPPPPPGLMSSQQKITILGRNTSCEFSSQHQPVSQPSLLQQHRVELSFTTQETTQEGHPAEINTQETPKASTQETPKVSTEETSKISTQEHSTDGEHPDKTAEEHPEIKEPKSGQDVSTQETNDEASNENSSKTSTEEADELSTVESAPTLLEKGATQGTVMPERPRTISIRSVPSSLSLLSTTDAPTKGDESCLSECNKEDTQQIMQVESAPNLHTNNLSAASPFNGMLTSTTPTHLLPEFSSWSLIILGSASLYNPAKGVEQVGFFTGSNYLLLWDIPIKASSGTPPLVAPPIISDAEEEQWPVPGGAPPAPVVVATPPPKKELSIFQTITQVRNQLAEVSSSDKAPVGKIKKPNSKETISLKAYIGNEYECPRGHRFFCSAPDKMVKASGGGHIRENAIKLVTANMPLYFPCPCRSSKPLHLAQIARAHVVTPDASVTVTVNPRVQPGEPDITPVFSTGVPEGVTLPPNSYCVLRFPYVYTDENGPILPPALSQPLLTCRLMRGMYNYSFVHAHNDTIATQNQ